MDLNVLQIGPSKGAPPLTHYARDHGPHGDSNAKAKLLPGVCLCVVIDFKCWCVCVVSFRGALSVP